jgi:hypothetical protein
VGEDVGARGSIRRTDGGPAVTPDMLWPLPKEPPPRPIDPAVHASRMSHPSVLAKQLQGPKLVLVRPEPRVIIREKEEILDLSDCGYRCGKGVWCEACRSDIRTEAMRWLRELNVVRPRGTGPALSWSRAWDRELLLADD